MYNRLPNLPTESPLSFLVSVYADDEVNDQTDRLKKSWQIAQELIRAVQQKRKIQYDKTAKQHKSSVGDFVIWKDKCRVQTKLGKLALQFDGPHKIIQVNEPNAVLLKHDGEEFIVHMQTLSAARPEFVQGGKYI